jgi:hypothetical protein
LELTACDGLHDGWRGNHLFGKMALLSATCSILSDLLNRNAGQIAWALFVAFAAATTFDTVVYPETVIQLELEG